MKAVVLRNLRSAITLGLMFWCAGAGCMLVSYAHSAAMSAGDAALVGSAQSSSGMSASMGAHSCCKARHASSKHSPEARASSHASEVAAVFERAELPEAPTPSGAMSCCPLTSGTFVVTARTRTNDSNSSALAAKDLLSRVLTNSQAPPRAFPLRLPNQNQTYLRGCVFLI
jgi:hypothetical protein